MLFVVDFPTTLFNTSLQGCFPSSFVAEIVIFFSAPLSQQSSFYSFVPEAFWCFSFHSSSCFGKIMFVSLLLHLTRVLCHLFKAFILSSFTSLSNLSSVWNPSYPLCHFFNTSGGSVLLISSSIFPSSQVHVLFPSMFNRSAARILPLSSCCNRSGFEPYLVN